MENGQVPYEMFRDMGEAYAVGLLMIYLLVAAQFKSYKVPLVIMEPIPMIGGFFIIDDPIFGGDYFFNLWRAGFYCFDTVGYLGDLLCGNV